ncbi:unnamed protein product [Caenorhabditis angaria]|uniref:F-box domain-containing protein n=1 Tax=Caenorhabditis angaria TaxID=860376 RepID=A0A9P1I853_9PELO|nr:unnamed protein product [Caenorhabditis angaria]
MSANWDDLPMEMKLEVCRYMEKEDRASFAQCSCTCFVQMLQVERDIQHLSVYQNEIDTYFMLGVNGVSLSFEQYGLQVIVRKDSKLFAKWEIDAKVLVFDLFAKILSNCRNSVAFIKIHASDFSTANLRVDLFPKLMSLEICSENRQQIYWFLSRSLNIVNLNVNFKEMEEESDTELLFNPPEFKILMISEVELKSNDAEVMLAIISRISDAEVFEEFHISISDEKFDGPDENLLEVFKKSQALNLDLKISIEQIYELLATPKINAIKFKNMATSTIADVILKCSAEKYRKRLCFKNVVGDLMEHGERLGLYQDYFQEGSENYMFYLPNTQGLYNTRTNSVSVQFEPF